MTKRGVIWRLGRLLAPRALRLTMDSATKFEHLFEAEVAWGIIGNEVDRLAPSRAARRVVEGDVFDEIDSDRNWLFSVVAAAYAQIKSGRYHVATSTLNELGNSIGEIHNIAIAQLGGRQLASESFLYERCDDIVDALEYPRQ